MKTNENAEKALKYMKVKKTEICGSEPGKVMPDNQVATKCLLQDPHPQYPAFTSKVDIRNTESQGRHVVAREAIKPGEVIAVDNAIIGSLVASKYSTNCLHCTASMVRIFPCPHCSLVRFCSFQCQQAAMESYHGYECKLGLGDLHKVGHSFILTDHYLTDA